MPCPRRAGTVRFRRLDARDRTARLAHIERLGREARRARFLGTGPPADLPEPRLAVGAFVHTRLVGLGELWALPDRSVAELALSVEPAFQNRGIGRQLFERLLAHARNRLFREVRTLCAEENGPVLALLRRHMARIVVAPPEAHARLALLPPTPATLLLEALDLGELLRERLLPAPGAAAALGLAVRPNGDQA
jgi:ribosomal protein S18 acetylase RimI-like enzyme